MGDDDPTLCTEGSGKPGGERLNSDADVHQVARRPARQVVCRLQNVASAGDSQGTRLHDRTA
jgi:hypothetical protein